MPDGLTRPRSTFIGRAPELGALEAALKLAGDRTVVVAVSGEAGVGKTRLVEEFLARVGTRARAARGTCVHLPGPPVPFAPFVAALHELSHQLGRAEMLRAAGPGGAELARLLPELGPAPVDSDVGRARMFEAVTVLLERGSFDCPLVLVLEDVHWADASTLDLLEYLQATVRTAHLLVVVTFRAEELGPDHPVRQLLVDVDRRAWSRTLALPRLHREHVRALLTELAGDSPSERQLDLAMARTQGVPYFVEELGLAPGDAPLPPSVRDLLLHRVRELGDEARDVLVAAAVGGIDVPHRRLARVADLPAPRLDAALRHLVDAHVLRVDAGGGGYTFWHALLREAVLGELLPGELGSLHAAWARAIEKDGGRRDSVAAAHHWWAARDEPRAFTSALRAADEAAAMYAYPEQQQLLRRVLDLWDSAPPEDVQGTDRAAVCVALAVAAWNAADQPCADAALVEALRLLSPADAPARVARALLMRAAFTAEYTAPRTKQWLERALQVCPAESHGLRAEILVALGMWYGRRGESAEEQQLARLALHEADMSGDPVPRVRALLALAWHVGVAGDLDRALAMFDECRAMAVEQHDAVDERFSFNWQSTLLVRSGRYQDASALAVTGRHRAQLLGLQRSMGLLVDDDDAVALLALGRWDDAVALVEQALAHQPLQDVGTSLRVRRALLLAARGDQRAEQAVAQVATTAQRYAAEPQLWAPALQSMAEWALARKTPERVWHVLDLVEARVAGPDVLAEYCWPIIALAARAGRDVPDLLERVRVLRDTAESSLAPPPADVPLYRAVVQAELSGGVEAWQTAAAATSAPGVEGPVYLRAYAKLRYAEALLGQGCPEAARGPLSDAVLDLRRLRAEPLLAQATTLARRHRLPLPAEVGRHRRDLPFGLTEREQQVLRRLATGASNAVIAEDLVISTRTVAVHVSHILSKLGVSSRTGAAAVAYEHGLVDHHVPPD